MARGNAVIQKNVLRKYPRAVLHMRQQIADQRFGLVLGAGVTKDLGFPDWATLVKRIAEHPKVQGASLLQRGRSNTSTSQMLFQHYRARQAENPVSGDQEFNRLEARVQAGWQRVVHEALFQDLPTDVQQIISKDRYLWAYLDVVRNTRLTINYNFDDTIQRMMDASSPPDRNRRNFTTIWNANIQMFPRNGVIYHPNGFLPTNLNEKPSEQLVFLEDSFADQLIDSMAGHYSALSYHLAQATRLFLGLSLADSTLKHLLRQSAHCHPGHYHYYVAYQKDDASADETHEKRISDANFEVYNLITLFLKSDEIAALGNLLTMHDKDFRHMAEEVDVPLYLRYLVTGSVGVGKSTAVSQFQSLRTFDEWLSERPPGMEKDPAKVSKERIQELDRWIIEQLNLKNLAMIDIEPGIHIVDRAPLDAFAFTPEPEWKDKALLIKNAISPGASKRTLAPAHIILLIGDPEVMAARAVAKHKVTDAAALRRQQELLKNVYIEKGPGVSVIDTRDRSVRQVVKEISRIIHLSGYTEAPLQKWLLDVEQGLVHA